MEDRIMLQHSVTVYVPSRQRDGSPVSDRDVLLQDTITALLGLCGGATVTDGVGYWQGDEGLAVEPVSLVTSYCESLEDIAGEVIALCEYLASRANQEAVSLALDNSLQFVSPPTPSWWLDYVPAKEEVEA